MNIVKILGPMRPRIFFTKILNENLCKDNIFLFGLQRFKYFGSTRSYLSAAYVCNDAWNNRVNDPLVRNVKSMEFFFEIIRKLKTEGKVSAIDTDIFVNSIKTESAGEFVDEIEEALRILRRSPETINTLESTHHTAIRLLLTAKTDEDILKIISDPMNYGVFLDPFLANLLMSSFLLDKNYMAAARVASTLMLQEDYGPELTKHLVLLSCINYSFNLSNNQEWIHYNLVEEPEEEVKIVVPYVRNPYFDDHFDIRNPVHIVGKTLAYLASHLNKGNFRTNAECLGWSLYEKWTELEDTLKRVMAESQILDKQVLSIIKSQVEKCDLEDLKMSLMSIVCGLEGREDLVKDLDLLNKIELIVKDEIQKFEKEESALLIKKYEDFQSIRKETLEKEKQLYERLHLLSEIKKKKKDLKSREEVIFFFDNQDKIEVALEKKREMYPEEEIVIKKTKEEEEDEYIPPEVQKRHT